MIAINGQEEREDDHKSYDDRSHLNCKGYRISRDEFQVYNNNVKEVFFSGDDSRYTIITVWTIVIAFLKINMETILTHIDINLQICSNKRRSKSRQHKFNH